jgi:hypothetical protein
VGYEEACTVPRVSGELWQLVSDSPPFLSLQVIMNSCAHYFHGTGGRCLVSNASLYLIRVLNIQTPDCRRRHHVPIGTPQEDRLLMTSAVWVCHQALSLTSNESNRRKLRTSTTCLISTKSPLELFYGCAAVRSAHPGSPVSLSAVRF